ncbi:MAG: thiamine phosphate synthase [Desulfuromonadales bacterium]
MSVVDFNLYLITDRLNLPAGKHLLTQVEAALLGGVRCVQLREKDVTTDDLLALAIEMRMLTAAFGARLLINGHPEIARTVDADGVHLGSDTFDVAETRRRLGPDKLIGVSTHHTREIASAAADGADFVTFGPVWFTASKATYGEPVGLDKLRAACTVAPLPLFALGGVTPPRTVELQKTGCSRVACIGAILHADEPRMAAKEFIRRLEGP